MKKLILSIAIVLGSASFATASNMNIADDQNKSTEQTTETSEKKEECKKECKEDKTTDAEKTSEEKKEVTAEN